MKAEIEANTKMIIDLHVHSKEISACGHVGITEIIDRYNAKGYNAIVVTNHLNDWSIGLRDSDSWSEYVDTFVKPVDTGREYAKKYGMRVFLGCELRFENDANDFLVYGMTPEFMKEHPEIRRLGIKKLKALADENDFLVYQAHPFRNGMTVVPPEHLHGIEVGNGHPRHDSRNDIARLWADNYNLMMIAGSDFHDPDDEAHGGILSLRNVNNEKELCELLRSNDFRLIVNQKGGF